MYRKNIFLLFGRDKLPQKENKMKFILISEDAISEIIQNRSLQSCEYLQGKSFSELLLGQRVDNTFDTQVCVVFENGGMYLLHNSRQSKRYLVIDMETSRIFANTTPDDVLFYFQKVARFALKYWNKMKLTHSERIVDSNKAVLFPGPFTTHSSFRIVIERKPDAIRLEKRDKAGNFLLVYRTGNDEGAGAKEAVSLTNFRKALDWLDRACSQVIVAEASASKPADITALSVTQLIQVDSPLLHSHLGFATWIDWLTDSQKRFVLKRVDGPERISGPAGTGKTLCLILKCINNLKTTEDEGREHHSLFITHSTATRKSIEDIFSGNDSNRYFERERTNSSVSVKITTLHEWCTEQLGTGISKTEYLDRDAMESKELQLLYVNEAVDEVLFRDMETYKKFLSPEFAIFLEKEDRWTLSQMIQHEISIVIKGRADEDLDKYKKIIRPEYVLRLRNEADRSFIYQIFMRYREKLRLTAQFDTDDIVISAIGQLNTPIWRRRREREGYDSIFVDETHLFNFNELSVFHHLTKTDKPNIIFSIDKSQAVGDIGINSSILEHALFQTNGETATTKMRAVFRCSPDIVNLAFSVTASGATLFTNFENPLEMVQSTFTEQEESKTKFPTYFDCINEEDMIEKAFKHAEIIVSEMTCRKSDVLIVPFTAELFKKMEAISKKHNKPIEMLKDRGDIEVVNRATRAGRFVMGSPDYIGGLEFNAVILVGVDHGRVPPSGLAATEDSSHFLSYAAHNRLYVALTRAKYRVEILGEKSRGPSALLDNALKTSRLERMSH